MKEERKEEERQTDRKNTRGTEQQRERTPQGNSATSTPPSNDRCGAIFSRLPMQFPACYKAYICFTNQFCRPILAINSDCNAVQFKSSSSSFK